MELFSLFPTDGLIHVDIRQPYPFRHTTIIINDLARGAIVRALRSVFSLNPWAKGFAPIHHTAPMSGEGVLVSVLFPSYGEIAEGKEVKVLRQTIKSNLEENFPEWKGRIKVHTAFIAVQLEEDADEQVMVIGASQSLSDLATQARVMTAGANSPHAAEIAEHVIGLGSVTETNTRHTQFDPKAT